MVKEILEKIRNKELTCVDHIQSLLNTIHEKNSELNIYLHLNETALADAARVDEKIAKGEAVGKLAGLGIALKSNICADGLIANCASKTLENYKATYDADVVARIRAADGIILGMVNMDEFASGGSGESSAFGCAVNPVCPDRVPGGSSSGSACVVAAGMCDIALGSDTGGSIRNPASHCGVVGVKPTYGRVSRYGLIDLSMSLDQIGPLSKTVYGSALMMEVISGYSDRDPTTISVSVENYSSFSDREFTIGVSSDFEKLCSDERIYSLVMSKISDTIDVTIPFVELAVQTYYPLVYVEFFSGTRKFDGRRYGKKIEDSAGDEVLRRIYGGMEISKAEHAGKFYRKALAVKEKISAGVRDALSQVDVLVLPVTPVLPHKVGTEISVTDMYAYDAFTIPANLAGICAGVVPVGEIDGVPIGLQVYARDEKTLFDFMKKIEDS